MRLFTLSLVLGLVATQAVAELQEDVQRRLDEAMAVLPTSREMALHRFLLLREAEWIVEQGLTAGPPRPEAARLMTPEAKAKRSALVRAAAMDFATFCEGREPQACLLAEAEALMAKAPEVDRAAERQGAIGPSEAGRQIAILLAKAGQFDEALRVARAIAEGRDRDRAVKGIVFVLADDRQFKRAGDTLRYLQRSAQLSEAMNGIVAVLLADGKREIASGLMPRAVEFASKIIDDRSRDQAMGRLGMYYLELGEIDAAEGLRDQIDDSYWRSVLARWVAGKMAEAGNAAAAERLAATVEDDDGLRAEAFQAVAVELAKAGQLAEARRVAGRVEGPVGRVVALGAVAASLGEARQQAEVFAEAGALARGFEDGSDRSKALVGVAEALIKAGDSSSAEAIVTELAEMNASAARTAWALQTISEALLDAGQQATALRYALQAAGPALNIQDAKERSDELLQLARLLIRLGAYSEAERVTTAIDRTTSRIFALQDLGVGLARAGRTAEAVRITAAIRGIEGAEDRPGSGLVKIAEALAMAGDLARAEAVAGAILGPPRRAEALARIVKAMNDAGRMTEAERIARRIEDVAWQAVALAAVASNR